MKIGLPQFKPSASDRQWVSNEIGTARFVGELWRAAGRKRREPSFVSLLVTCGWTNVREDDSGWESTRIWRNRNLADYLQLEYSSDRLLVDELSRAFPRLKNAAALVGRHTGITHYYKALRPATLAFVEAHAHRIAEAFALAASTRLTPQAKIKRVLDIVASLGPIRIRNTIVSPFYGLTPTLACLDPFRRLPIMNVKTRRLLHAISEGCDAKGALALARLIGLNGIKNSFELDVYAATGDFSHVRRPKGLKAHPGNFRDVGLKSETSSLANINANRIKITKRHNQLTNRFWEWLQWRQIAPKESRFDAVVLDWKEGRHLLIEAKTASDRSSGRMQIRQAIGQLFDYRYTYAASFPPGEVDLAVLLPTRPGEDIRLLLRSLDIETLWFERGRLEGSVEL